MGWMGGAGGWMQVRLLPSRWAGLPRPRLKRPPGAGARGVHSLASPPLVPAGARGLGVRLSLLHRPAPALPGFLFNNIAREAPAESTRQNFLPGRGWAAAGRDNPRCPGFLSPLGRASASGAETPPPPPRTSQDPGTHLAISREVEAAGPGWWDHGRRKPPHQLLARFPSHCLISTPFLILVGEEGHPPICL